jgi:DNA-binding HxlR family transcriptional regulator
MDMTLLSNKLLKLQYEGLISKKIYSDVSTIVEYKLTGRVSEPIVILEELGGLLTAANSIQLYLYEYNNKVVSQ